MYTQSTNETKRCNIHTYLACHPKALLDEESCVPGVTNSTLNFNHRYETIMSQLLERKSVMIDKSRTIIIRLLFLQFLVFVTIRHH